MVKYFNYCNNFIFSYFIHIFMFYVFAFGGSMLIEKQQKKQYHIHQGIEKLKKKKKINDSKNYNMLVLY